MAGIQIPPWKEAVSPVPRYFPTKTVPSARENTWIVIDLVFTDEEYEL